MEPNAFHYLCSIGLFHCIEPERCICARRQQQVSPQARPRPDDFNILHKLQWYNDALQLCYLTGSPATQQKHEVKNIPMSVVMNQGWRAQGHPCCWFHWECFSVAKVIWRDVTPHLRLWVAHQQNKCIAWRRREKRHPGSTISTFFSIKSMWLMRCNKSRTYIFESLTLLFSVALGSAVLNLYSFLLKNSVNCQAQNTYLRHVHLSIVPCTY